ARQAIDKAREAIRGGGEAPALSAIVGDAEEILAERDRAHLSAVINATGVLLHTNLGRSPLGDAQLAAIAKVSKGYSNLEFDLQTGKRGSRYQHAARAVAEATGAEDAVVVNNNAAAVLLVLAALCAGREVIISRGELVEIGGEFRIPDVMKAAGVRLAEIGTTNRTHIADYERAITPDTAAILKVHPSNYRVVGFASSVAAREVARLARGRGLLFLHDLGSGLLDASSDATWARDEPTVRAALEEGADLVTFSGDKLLGGPQAGVIAGRAQLIGRLMGHPLLRALRVDKMTLAALEATLSAHADGSLSDLPLWRMAGADQGELEGRAKSVALEVGERLGAGFKVEAVPSEAVLGGGAAPGREIPSWAVAVSHGERSGPELERAMRRADPPVVPRVTDDRILLDLRTVPADLDGTLVKVCCEVLG
ncbi:MAG: L-seryl-tRNA(Ser) seleniumtransferase, partial [Actinomycetota bacterium]|nr:L-seryl-tRNA(Ser) seleniumtransferase [Actinomycetota bacterium]